MDKHVEVLRLLRGNFEPQSESAAALTAAIAALEAVGDAEILTIGYSSREDVMHRITDDWMLDFKDREASKGDPADGDYYLIPADAAGRLEMTALKAGKRGAK
ncbi:hypothetical protein [Aquilutibacter rugosus]|uniref:hypothetical protein n=1 Tax=Aquilutibacter rugosus TaxID=3115820 RepID=UPI002F3F16FE